MISNVEQFHNYYTHTLQYSQQTYSIHVHNKISKTNFRCKVLIGEGKTFCTPIPQKFSHNHKATNCWYMQITKTSKHVGNIKNIDIV